MTSTVTPDGDVISYVNISSIRVSDGGTYRCTARNRVGVESFSGKLLVYGMCLNYHCYAQYTPPTPTRLSCGVASRRRRRCERNLQLAHDDWRWIRSTIWKLARLRFDYVHFDQY